MIESGLQRDLDHILAHTADVWESLRGRSIFITGGTGFVGTWLTQALVYANDRLQLHAKAVLLTRDPAALRAKAPFPAEDHTIHSIAGDICSFEFPEGVFPFVIHAATDYLSPCPNRPLDVFERDIQGTRRVLEFARTHGAERLLFTSSGVVYGLQPRELTYVPEDYCGAPSTMDVNSSFGQAKRVCEWLCAMYAHQFGFESVIARMFAFVGPYLALDENYAIGNFIRDVIAGGPVRIHGDGTPYRSYLYAADMAIWLWRMLVHGKSLHPCNVGSDDALSIADVARLVVEATAPGTPIEIARQPTKGVSPERYVPSIERARRELGLRPMIHFQEGVRRTYEWALKRK